MSKLPRPTVYFNFTYKCMDCGHTVQVVNGQKVKNKPCGSRRH